MFEATPYREVCPNCKDLESKLARTQDTLANAEKRQREHRCWSLGKETDGSTTMDILSTGSLVASVIAFAVAAHGATRWSVGACLLVGAVLTRLWGVSFRIW